MVLGTAHPAKFLDVMDEVLGGGVVEVPERLGILRDREKAVVEMSTSEREFHSWLRDFS